MLAYLQYIFSGGFKADVELFMGRRKVINLFNKEVTLIDFGNGLFIMDKTYQQNDMWKVDEVTSLFTDDFELCSQDPVDTGGLSDKPGEIGSFAKTKEQMISPPPVRFERET